VRRANAPVALDDGKSVRQVRGFLHLGPGMVRGRLRGFRGTGLAPVDPAAYPEREGKLTRDQETSPVAALRATPPRDTNGVRDIILRRFGVEYTRRGAIKLMHRLGFGYIKPKPLPRQPPPLISAGSLSIRGRNVAFQGAPDGASRLLSGSVVRRLPAP